MSAGRPMEFLRRNLLETGTTVALVNATNAANTTALYDNNAALAFSFQPTVTSATTGSVRVFRITLPTSSSIDTLLVRNVRSIGLLSFRFINFTVTQGAAIGWSDTDASDHYMRFTGLAANVIDVYIDAYDPEIVSIGELVVSRQEMPLTTPASIEGFSPRDDRRQTLHRMPDGGVYAYNIANKFQANLNFECVSESYRLALLSIASAPFPFVFVPNATASAKGVPTPANWDGVCPEVVVTSDFDFRPASVNMDAGWSGGISIAETSGDS